MFSLSLITCAEESTRGGEQGSCLGTHWASCNLSVSAESWREGSVFSQLPACGGLRVVRNHREAWGTPWKRGNRTERPCSKQNQGIFTQCSPTAALSGVPRGHCRARGWTRTNVRGVGAHPEAVGFELALPEDQCDVVLATLVTARPGQAGWHRAGAQ